MRIQLRIPQFIKKASKDKICDMGEAREFAYKCMFNQFKPPFL